MKVFTGRGANQPFTCAYCGFAVPPLASGGYRNHCPKCLTSLHVDITPGDRANDCHGLLRPIGVEPGKKGWVIVQQCNRCGEIRRNRAALHDPVPDDYDLIIELSTQGTP